MMRTKTVSKQHVHTYLQPIFYFFLKSSSKVLRRPDLHFAPQGKEGQKEGLSRRHGRLTRSGGGYTR